ncbi:endonuclease MutS2 [Heliorestis convoluta]|uniref:Endonuclease MutS2 n=1 Tax=Heliorestis convoluta TaxID=356322 RepID=A0A5Q2N583_9FIRM|nr:endonuclease MutS2 [Heliorestis convoluta]
MKEPILQKLEFHKIVEKLVNLCTSSIGKDEARSLQPSTKRWYIEESLAETTEAKETIRLRPNVPLAGIKDIRGPLKKAEVGGMLEPDELLAIASTFEPQEKCELFY